MAVWAASLLCLRGTRAAACEEASSTSPWSRARHSKSQQAAGQEHLEDQIECKIWDRVPLGVPLSLTRDDATCLCKAGAYLCPCVQDTTELRESSVCEEG